MSDIHETEDRYTSVCREAGQKPNPFIAKIFQKEKDTCILESKTSMHLYLAGNDRDLTDARLTDEDVGLLCKALADNVYIISIDLRYNNITDEGAQHLATFIEESPVLQELNLMNNDITEAGAQHLAKALHKNETLMNLQMTGNKIGKKGGMYFAQALQINMSLEALDLCDTDQKTESVIALATVLNYNTTLKALNVSRPILFSQQEETTFHFARMLNVNRTLKELHLMKCDIRDFGATRLAENLIDNFSLAYLNLSCNRITMDGAKELAKVLKKDTGLKILDLGFNRLGDDGAHHLAEAVSTYNTRLTTLVVTNNEMTGKGLCSLADSLQMNSSLTNLYIWGNSLDEAACIAFSKLLESGRLEPANVDVESYSVDGVSYLAELNHGIRRHYYCGLYGDKEQRPVTVSHIM